MKYNSIGIGDIVVLFVSFSFGTMCFLPPDTTHNVFLKLWINFYPVSLLLDDMVLIVYTIPFSLFRYLVVSGTSETVQLQIGAHYHSLFILEYPFSHWVLTMHLQYARLLLKSLETLVAKFNMHSSQLK